MEQLDIRRLPPSDADRFRTIRLEALQCDPEAFGSTFEIESTQPLAWFEDRLSKADVFGAFRGSDLVGIAGFAAQEGPKHKHKGVLWGMYVLPRARNAGIGRALAEAIVAHAQNRVMLIQLSVVSENVFARRLYASLGFVEYGLEKNALNQNGRYYDDVLMAKALADGNEP